MNAEALKIILDLQKENTLLKRAIIDAIVMLNKKEEYYVIQYGNDEADYLITEVVNVLSSLRTRLSEPPDDTQSSSNTT